MDEWKDRWKEKREGGSISGQMDEVGVELSLKSTAKYGYSPLKRGHKIKKESLGGSFLS